MSNVTPEGDRPLTSMDIVLRMEEKLEAAIAKKTVPVSLGVAALLGGVCGAVVAIAVNILT